jgi:DNA-directed RNA polymerase subunit beta'
MAFWPQLTKNNTLELSPLVNTGFNADYDGDAMQFHVPSSAEAVKEAQEKMMPSHNLLNVQRFDTNYMPTMEYTGGLWHASVKENDKQVRTFHSKKDAIAAYRRGDIDAGQKIEIHS